MRLGPRLAGSCLALAAVAGAALAGPPLAPARGAGPSPASRPEAGASEPVRHTVRRGQTLFSISRLYGVPQQAIAAANGITDPRRLRAGARLVIPGGRIRPASPAKRSLTPSIPARAAPPLRAFLVAPLPWPVAGPVISGFARPRHGHNHKGIDIRASAGTPIRAVADGVVLLAEEHYGSYGRAILIEHENGMVSVYGHNEENLVHAGERVRAEEVIGKVGRSGNASTDHLHFELRVAGRPVDPTGALASKAQARGGAAGSPE